jgi:hypothetical protein
MRVKLLWPAVVVLGVALAVLRAQSLSPQPSGQGQRTPHGTINAKDVMSVEGNPAPVGIGRYKLYSVGASPTSAGLLYRLDAVTGKTCLFIVSERTATAPGTPYWREILEEQQAFPAK